MWYVYIAWSVSQAFLPTSPFFNLKCQKLSCTNTKLQKCNGDKLFLLQQKSGGTKINMRMYSKRGRQFDRLMQLQKSPKSAPRGSPEYLSEFHHYLVVARRPLFCPSLSHLDFQFSNRSAKCSSHCQSSYVQQRLTQKKNNPIILKVMMS